MTREIENWRRLRLPAVICILYFLTISLLARAHPFGTYGPETDFYQYYGPDAERIAAGQFPHNPYQGPGYPAVLALISKFTGDTFTAGKWISVFSAALIALLVFLLFERFFDYWIAVGAEAIVVVSGQFLVYSIQATTDCFFLLLCLIALLVLLRGRFAVAGRVALAGAVSGLAYLTRYNGIFLVGTGIVGIVALNLYECRWRERCKLAALFIASFFLVISPWLYANYTHRGSPFYNTNYLNIAAEYYPELAGGVTNQDATRALSQIFRSFTEVFRYDPWRMLTHYPVVLGQSLWKSLTTKLVSGWVGFFALVGLALLLSERRSRPVMLLLFSGVLYFLLMALNHWETRYYLYIAPLYAGLAVYAAFQALELVRARGFLQHRLYTALPLACILILWVSSVALSHRELSRFMVSHPTELLSACAYFEREGIHDTRVMARKPHLPYICRQQWVFVPSVQSIGELRAWVESNSVNYLVIGRQEVSSRPVLSVLRNPQAAPPWLKTVWTSPNYLLYRVENPQPDNSSPLQK
jgi:hypothetical protein